MFMLFVSTFVLYSMHLLTFACIDSTEPKMATLDD